MNQKTFYKIIIDFNINPAKSKFYVDDKRLTFNEKKILDAYFLIRNNENVEAMKLMKGLAPSSLPFVEAQRLLLIGLSLNNQSLYHEAEESILKALSLFKELGTHFSVFMCYFNLSFIYFNLMNREKMKLVVEALKSIEFETEFQRIRYLRVKFAYLTLTEQITEANIVLSEIELSKGKMPESDRIAQLIIEFMFFSAQQDFIKCRKILIEMKSYRKFHLTENYIFMKKLLDHLTFNVPIYFYDDKFFDVPILNYQLKVIQSLEEMDIENAKEHWRKLSAIMPEIFGESFAFKGRKCLFSLCLDKHLSNVNKEHSCKKSEELNLIISLHDLLKSSDRPLSKSYIYEFLWNDVPVEKSDFNKLERLISRLRSEKQVRVVYRKGTYFLDKINRIKKTA